MKIKLMSDIHLEFPNSDVELVRDDADVLVLAGDICTAYNIQDFVPFFERAASIFPHVVYIAGNHESYGYKLDDPAGTITTLAVELRHLKNLYVMDGGHHTIDGVTFWAGTLWTDCNKGDYTTRRVLQRDMNDYRRIKYGQRRLAPEDTEKLHAQYVEALTKFLDENTASGNPIVVVTHHTPSPQSINAKYRHEFHMNGGYSSDLRKLIDAHPEIKLWCHGHTHNSFDYVEGSTRVLCNPAGYPIKGRDGKLYRENPDFNPRLVVEV